MVITKQDQANNTGTSAPGHTTEITTTIASVSQNPLTDAEFTIPSGFKETSLPDIFGKKNTAPSVSPGP